MPDKNLELLAPAGKWDVLEAVVEAGADAVYLGGKLYNMRLLRKEYNFSDAELAAAAEYLHTRNKKLYVTVNNLYYDDQIGGLDDYLHFLQEIQVDALIIQDLGMVKIVRDNHINIPMHASVQMGICSTQAVKFLNDIGFSRVILSKNVALDEIKAIYQQTEMAIEFFTHGDLCISHTGQCYMSSFINGKSGNRGMCVKPCRWQYSLQPFRWQGYHLSHQDLCLYPLLETLVASGVSSFKIEGRMREAGYIAKLIGLYRAALDRVIAGSGGGDESGWRQLYDMRMRDYCTGNLTSRPSADSIGISGEREPLFPTSPVILQKLEAGDYLEYPVIDGNHSPELSIKVRDLEAFSSLLNTKIDNLILGYEYYRREQSGWNIDTIHEALKMIKTGCPGVAVELPRIVTEHDTGKIIALLENVDVESVSFITNDYGCYQLLKNRKCNIYGGYGLNVSNNKAAEFLLAEGFDKLTASLELSWQQLTALLNFGQSLEILIHGPLCGIVTDYCLARTGNGRDNHICAQYCAQQDISLQDTYGQDFKVRTDMDCRNYIFYPHDLCLFTSLPRLITAGAKYLRIDAQFYDQSILTPLVNIYLSALRNLKSGTWQQQYDFSRLLKMFPQGLAVAPPPESQE